MPGQNVKAVQAGGGVRIQRNRPALTFYPARAFSCLRGK